MTGFDVQVDHAPPRGSVVVVQGELDIAAAPTLRERCFAAIGTDPGVVVVDLAGTAFIDACGARALADVERRVTQHRGRFWLAGVRPTVRRVLDLVSVTQRVWILEPGRTGAPVVGVRRFTGRGCVEHVSPRGRPAVASDAGPEI
jgi:anti-sigma B factor antagonist